MHAQTALVDRSAVRDVSARLRQVLLCLLVTLCTALPGPLPAETGHGTFKVVAARTEKGEDGYLLSAQLHIRLSAGAREALDNGIPLVIEFQIQALETHAWFWDDVIEEIRHARQISYHALSRTYVVRDIYSGRQQNFRSLQDALLMAGFLQELPVLDYQLLGDNKNYQMRMRGSLDIESLPTPVRLLAYVSSAWDMDSEWHKWQLAR
jgi:hypothetical protein